MNSTHLRTLLAASLLGILVFSGCLTVDPSVTADTNESVVFEEFSVDEESWATNRVRANATLAPTPAAGNVTAITVIGENGKPFSTRDVAAGQTTVALAVPPNQNATLVASNSVNSTIIEKINVNVTGDTIF